MAQNVLVPSCRVERTRTVFLTVLLALYSLCYITEKCLFWIYSCTEGGTDAAAAADNFTTYFFGRLVVWRSAARAMDGR